MVVLDKDGLYKETGWFSKDCEKIVDSLKKFGLVIVKEEDLETFRHMEDDLK